LLKSDFDMGADEERQLRTSQRESVVACDLPLVLAARLVEDVFLAVNGEDAILHDALPVL
jgi:hypothetical protein